MTMPRAFDELETAKLAEMMVRGRERFLRFIGDRKVIWRNALPFPRSRVSKRLIIHRTEGAVGAARARLTALAHYSMLAPPAYTTSALSQEDCKALRQRHKTIEVQAQDPDASEFGVWWYPPALFDEDSIVDQLLLYLSLKEDHDERTETALEEMMEKLKW